MTSTVLNIPSVKFSVSLHCLTIKLNFQPVCLSAWTPTSNQNSLMLQACMIPCISMKIHCFSHMCLCYLFSWKWILFPLLLQQSLPIDRDFCSLKFSWNAIYSLLTFQISWTKRCIPIFYSYHVVWTILIKSVQSFALRQSCITHSTLW